MAITTNTAETAQAINREIQWLRHPRPADGVELHDGTSEHVGDKIATRRNDPTARADQGEKVRNRQTWTVTATHADGAITAHHAERGTVVLPADYVARHVELDWAVTGYGNQGDTVDIGIAVLEGSSSRNHAYVAMTRGRHANHALVVDAEDTTDPGERLTDIITRPTTVEPALAVQARLHREAGQEPPDHSAPMPRRPDRSPEAAPSSPTERTHEQKIAEARDRLDRVQYRDRSPDRGLGL